MMMEIFREATHKMLQAMILIHGSDTTHYDQDVFASIRSGIEVAVVYYRSGYSPDNYPSEKVTMVT